MLYPTKTEALGTGTRQQLAKFTIVIDVTAAGTSIPFYNTLRILGVTLDEKLNGIDIGNVVG